MCDNKWYFTHHIHHYSVSIFETDSYEGRGGYDTREEAVYAACKHATLEIELTSNKVLQLSSELNRAAEHLDKMLKVKKGIK